MQAKSDTRLLREYAGEKSEPAFGEIVQRHADLVYSAALRQAGSPDLAREIAQRVFIDLARKAQSVAGKMRQDASLAGWLYRATRYAALNLLREERRRQIRARQIMQELQSAPEASPDWHSVSPLLDEAISGLDEKEREALLLRFFKNQEFRAVGAALGVSDDAAQKRVSRGLEKLRDALQKRGVTTTPTALAAVMSCHAVEVAPAGLAAALISASVASTTTGGGATLTLIKLMSMTKLQIGVATIIVGALAVTVAIQHQNAGKLRDDDEALRRQVASLTSDNESLSNRPKQTTAAAPNRDDQFRELLRLRGEVGRLREQANLIGKLQEENRRLQSGTGITKQQGVEAAKFLGYSASVVNAEKQIGLAMRIYANDNGDKFPTNFAQMSNELAGFTNFGGQPLSDIFEMVNVGKASDSYPQAATARERNPRQSPFGGWERAYLLDDGSVQMASSPDGNFDGWEQSNYANAFPPQNP